MYTGFRTEKSFQLDEGWTVIVAQFENQYFFATYVNVFEKKVFLKIPRNIRSDLINLLSSKALEEFSKCANMAHEALPWCYFQVAPYSLFESFLLIQSGKSITAPSPDIDRLTEYLLVVKEWAQSVNRRLHSSHLLKSGAASLLCLFALLLANMPTFFAFRESRDYLTQSSAGNIELFVYSLFLTKKQIIEKVERQKTNLEKLEKKQLEQQRQKERAKAALENQRHQLAIKLDLAAGTLTKQRVENPEISGPSRQELSDAAEAAQFTLEQERPLEELSKAYQRLQCAIERCNKEVTQAEEMRNRILEQVTLLLGQADSSVDTAPLLSVKKVIEGEKPLKQKELRQLQHEVEVFERQLSS